MDGELDRSCGRPILTALQYCGSRADPVQSLDSRLSLSYMLALSATGPGQSPRLEIRVAEFQNAALRYRPIARTARGT